MSGLSSLPSGSEGSMQAQPQPPIGKVAKMAKAYEAMVEKQNQPRSEGASVRGSGAQPKAFSAMQTGGESVGVSKQPVASKSEREGLSGRIEKEPETASSQKTQTVASEKQLARNSVSTQEASTVGRDVSTVSVEGSDASSRKSEVSSGQQTTKTDKNPQDARLKRLQDAINEARDTASKTKPFSDKYNKAMQEVKDLKAKIARLENKPLSKLRSLFPGGGLNKAKIQLKVNQEAMRICGAQVMLQSGAIRSEISDKFTGGISSPKSREEVDKMSKELVSNLEELREHLIDQIPRIPIDLSKDVGKSTNFCEDKNNNYVIHLGMHEDLKYDPDTEMLTLKGEKGDLSVQVSKGKIVDGKITVGEPKMCDQAQFSKKTHGGKVQMASFNDGNDWGDKSMGAAIKANESALSQMEEGVQSLLDGGKPVTSQDIIRIHDQALMKAQDDVASSNLLGSTCPQLLTVAGDVAHISTIGDTKCFVIGTDLSIKDPTEGIRGGYDAKDPGGRIGGAGGDTTGYIVSKDKSGEAISGGDLRNYTHALLRLNPGDTVVMCSDGIADNLDPEMQGLSPKDCGLKGDEWNSDDKDHTDYRNKYQAAQIKVILQDYKKEKGLETLSPDDVGKALNQFVHNQTIARKMLTIHQKEPESKKDFPGKMDHAGMLIYQHP
jgi:hypothetical protein